MNKNIENKIEESFFKKYKWAIIAISLVAILALILLLVKKLRKEKPKLTKDEKELHQKAMEKKGIQLVLEDPVAQAHKANTEVISQIDQLTTEHASNILQQNSAKLIAFAAACNADANKLAKDLGLVVLMGKGVITYEAIDLYVSILSGHQATVASAYDSYVQASKDFLRGVNESLESSSACTKRTWKNIVTNKHDYTNTTVETTVKNDTSNDVLGGILFSRQNNDTTWKTDSFERETTETQVVPISVCEETVITKSSFDAFNATYMTALLAGYSAFVTTIRGVASVEDFFGIDPDVIDYMRFQMNRKLKQD